jgi:hypothetical protein
VQPVASATFSETVRRLREDHHTWRDSIDRCLEAAELLEKHLAPAAQPAVPLTVAQKGVIHAATASMQFYEAVEFAIRKTEAAHGITAAPEKGQS